MLVNSDPELKAIYRVTRHYPFRYDRRVYSAETTLYRCLYSVISHYTCHSVSGKLGGGGVMAIACKLLSVEDTSTDNLYECHTLNN